MVLFIPNNYAKLNWATSWENLFMLYANNKGADQPVHRRSLISAFVFGCQESIIRLVSISEVPSIYLDSVAEDAGLSLHWLQTRRQVFSWRGSIMINIFHKVPPLQRQLLVHVPLTCCRCYRAVNSNFKSEPLDNNTMASYVTDV